MSVGKILGGSVLAVVGVVVVGGLALPADYEVERSLRIEAEPAVVFDHIVDVYKMQAWSPWKAKDPSMEITYGDPRRGVGAWYSWKGPDSGEGKYTITSADAGKALTSRIEFVGMGESEGFWRLEQDGEGTLATWGFRGTNETPIIGPWFTLFMDSMVGPDFEDGLKRLAPIAKEDAAKREEASKAFADAAKGWKLIEGDPEGAAARAAEEFAKALEEAAKAQGK